MDEDRTLRAMMKGLSLRLVILDPLPQYHSTFMPLTQPEEAIPSLRRIAAATECHILAILPINGHERLTGESAHLYRHLYTVETVFLLRDHRGTRTLTVARAKGEECEEEVVLHLDEETGRVIVGDAWEAVLFWEGREAILAALAAGPCTERELESRVRGKRSVIPHILRILLAGGIIERSGGGKRGDPYRYHRHRASSGGSRGSRGSRGSAE